MATYVLISRLTDEGCATLTKNPERIKEVNADVESMGGRIVAQWVVLGPFDFINVVEAPDNATIAKISVQLASRGTVRIETHPCLNSDEFIYGLK